MSHLFSLLPFRNHFVPFPLFLRQFLPFPSLLNVKKAISDKNTNIVEENPSPSRVFLEGQEEVCAKIETASSRAFPEVRLVSIEEYVVEDKLICSYSAIQAVYERTVTRSSDGKIESCEDIYVGFDYPPPIRA